MLHGTLTTLLITATLVVTPGAFASDIPGCVSPHEVGACVGDCDGDNTVVVSELIQGVNHALGYALSTVCYAIDPDNDCTAEIHELIQGVNNALGGCPAVNTATPTATGSQVPTSTSTPIPPTTTVTATATNTPETPFLTWESYSFCTEIDQDGITCFDELTQPFTQEQRPSFVGRVRVHNVGVSGAIIRLRATLKDPEGNIWYQTPDEPISNQPVAPGTNTAPVHVKGIDPFMDGDWTIELSGQLIEPLGSVMQFPTVSFHVGENTPTPTSSATITRTPASTNTATTTPTHTEQPVEDTATPTVTVTGTVPSTNTPTATSTSTASATRTATPVVTATATATNTASPSPTPFAEDGPNVFCGTGAIPLGDSCSGSEVNPPFAMQDTPDFSGTIILHGGGLWTVKSVLIDPDNTVRYPGFPQEVETGLFGIVTTSTQIWDMQFFKDGMWRIEKYATREADGVMRLVGSVDVQVGTPQVPTATPTNTVVPTSTSTPSATSAPATQTPTFTATMVPTNTTVPTSTMTVPPASTSTATPVSTATATATGTATSTNTAVPTSTTVPNTATATHTSVPTATVTATNVPNTPVSTSTSTPTSTRTATSVPATSTPTVTRTTVVDVRNVSISNEQVEVGDTGTATISIENVTGVSGFSFHVIYDSSIITITSITKLLPGDDCLFASNTNVVWEDGTLRKVIISIGCTNPLPVNTTEIVSLAFTANMVGVSPLTLDTCYLNEGSPDCSEWHGSVEVVSSTGNPTHTATMTGTATAVPATPTSTVTNVPTFTATAVPSTSTPTVTATVPPASTSTATPVSTATATATGTSTRTSTRTATSVPATSTPTATPTTKPPISIAHNVGQLCSSAFNVICVNPQTGPFMAGDTVTFLQLMDISDGPGFCQFYEELFFNGQGYYNSIPHLHQADTGNTTAPARIDNILLWEDGLFEAQVHARCSETSPPTGAWQDMPRHQIQVGTPQVPTATPTNTVVPTSTSTPSATSAPATQTPTFTATMVPTNTTVPTSTMTVPPASTSTATPVSTATATATGTATSTNTAVPTSTTVPNTATATHTSVPTATVTATNVPNTPVSTSTSTPTSTRTATSVPATSTPTVTPAPLTCDPAIDVNFYTSTQGPGTLIDRAQIEEELDALTEFSSITIYGSGGLGIDPNDGAYATLTPTELDEHATCIAQKEYGMSVTLLVPAGLAWTSSDIENAAALVNNNCVDALAATRYSARDATPEQVIALRNALAVANPGFPVGIRLPEGPFGEEAKGPELKNSGSDFFQVVSIHENPAQEPEQAAGIVSNTYAQLVAFGIPATKITMVTGCNIPNGNTANCEIFFNQVAGWAKQGTAASPRRLQWLKSKDEPLGGFRDFGGRRTDGLWKSQLVHNAFICQ